MNVVEPGKSLLVTKYVCFFFLLPSLVISHRRKLLANSVSLNQNGTSSTFPRSWQSPVEQSSRVCPGAAPGSAPSWSFSSDRNSPKPTNPPSVLSVHSSSFSAKTNQTLDSPCVSRQRAEELPCPGTAELPFPRGREGASLGLSPQPWDSSWEKSPAMGSGRQPVTSTALRAQGTAPSAGPAGNSSAGTDLDFDLDHFDIDDLDEDWESSEPVPAPGTPPTPLCPPGREGPPAKSLLSKIMSRAQGSSGGPSPAAPNPGLLMATKNHPGELHLLVFFHFKILYFILHLRPSNCHRSHPCLLFLWKFLLVPFLQSHLVVFFFFPPNYAKLEYSLPGQVSGCWKVKMLKLEMRVFLF